MIVFLAVAFFFIGYGYAAKGEIMKAQDYLAEFQEEHICTKINFSEQWQQFREEQDERYNFNFTWDPQ